MTRWIVAVAFAASLPLAVPATLTSQPDEPARPSPEESHAIYERARSALAHRRDALAAGAISPKELDPVTLDALRALALEAAIGSGDRHPYDGRVYMTTVRKAAAATGDGVPEDRPVFWVILRGHFVFERHGPLGMVPGPPLRATRIEFMMDAKTLHGVGGGYSNHDPDTSGLGPATPLGLEPGADSLNRECTATREHVLLAARTRRGMLAAGKVAVTELDPLTLAALRALAYDVGTCNGDPYPDARVQVTTRRKANLIWDAGIDSDRPSFFVVLHGNFDRPIWKAGEGPTNPTASNTATWISVVADAETLRITDYGIGTRAEDSRALGPTTPLIP